MRWPARGRPSVRWRPPAGVLELFFRFVSFTPLHEARVLGEDFGLRNAECGFQNGRTLSREDARIAKGRSPISKDGNESESRPRIRVAENITARGGIGMEETSDKATAKTRKPYAKPEVSQVQLRPEEAVLGFCKSSSRSGPVHFRCNLAGSCLSLGS